MIRSAGSYGSLWQKKDLTRRSDSFGGGAEGSYRVQGDHRAGRELRA
jgi:hypothetical protein